MPDNVNRDKSTGRKTLLQGRRLDILLLVIALSAISAYLIRRNSINQAEQTPVQSKQGQTSNQGGKSGPDAAKNLPSELGPVARAVQGERIARLLPPLFETRLSSVSEATHMRDDDLVFGVVVNGVSRAYPWWVAKNYHAINDMIGETPVLLAFCEQCSAAGAFKRTANGKKLTMMMLGLYKGSIMLQDRETKSLWAPFDGTAIEGELSGHALERFPAFLTRWDDWRTRHPDTDVVYDNPAKRAGHGSWYRPGKWGIMHMMGQTLDTWDERLAENDFVLGLKLGNTKIAYPMATVEQSGGVINDTVEKTPVVILKRGEFELTAYERRIEGKTLSFLPAKTQGTFKDDQTASTWNIEGLAIAGQLKGKQLPRVDGYLAEWHIWHGYHPKTVIFGGLAKQYKVGFKFPDFEWLRLKTGLFEIVKPTKKLNVIALWAVWCPPCRKELPALQKMVDARNDDDVSVITVALHMPGSYEADVVRKFVAEHDLRLPVFLVNDDDYDQLDSLLRQSGGPGIILPMVLIVNENGKVESILKGKQVDDLNSTIDALLKAAPATSPSSPDSPGSDRK